MARYYVTDKIDGVLDESASFATEAEAKALIERLEAKDKDLGRYTEGFYIIEEVDEDGEEMI